MQKIGVEHFQRCVTLSFRGLPSPDLLGTAIISVVSTWELCCASPLHMSSSSGLGHFQDMILAAIAVVHFLPVQGRRLFRRKALLADIPSPPSCSPTCSLQKSLNLFGAGFVWTAVLVIEQPKPLVG
jgi:hypothetical protein